MPSTFEGYVVYRTGKAILFNGHYWDGALWFPLSQINVVEDPESIEWVISVADWLCNKKGLLEFSHYSEEEIENMSGF